MICAIMLVTTFLVLLFICCVILNVLPHRPVSLRAQRTKIEGIYRAAIVRIVIMIVCRYLVFGQLDPWVLKSSSRGFFILVNGCKLLGRRFA